MLGGTAGTIFGFTALAALAAVVKLGIRAVIGAVRHRRSVAYQHAIHAPKISPPSAGSTPMSPGRQRRELWWMTGGPGCPR